MIRRLKRDVLDQLPPKRRQRVQISADGALVEKVQKYMGIITRMFNHSLTKILQDKSKLNMLKEHRSAMMDGDDDNDDCIEEIIRKMNPDALMMNSTLAQSFFSKGEGAKVHS